MYRTITAMVVAGILMAACSGGNETGGVEVEADGEAPVESGAMPDSMPGMDHDNMPGMDHDSMPGIDQDTMSGMDHDAMSGTGGADAMDHGGMPAGAGEMAGMDHSRMDMGRSSSRGAGAPGGMAAMDHSQMPGMEGQERGAARTVGGSGNMAGMDHSGMAMADRSAGDSPGARMEMQHGNTPGSAGGDMPAMQHGDMNMGGTQAALLPADAATEKLLTLVRELVEDPAVQQEIQQDPALREAWTNTGVRRILLNRR